MSISSEERAAEWTHGFVYSKEEYNLYLKELEEQKKREKQQRIAEQRRKEEEKRRKEAMRKNLPFGNIHGSVQIDIDDILGLKKTESEKSAPQPTPKEAPSQQVSPATQKYLNDLFSK